MIEISFKLEKTGASSFKCRENKQFQIFINNLRIKKKINIRMLLGVLEIKKELVLKNVK